MAKQWERFEMLMPPELLARLRRAARSRSDVVSGRRMSVAGFLREAALQKLNREGDE